MNALLHAAADLQAVCDRHRWQYCFIGGLAVLRWGEPRETVDVDLTLLTGFSNETEYINKLLQVYAPRIEDAANFALTNRVLLLRASSGVGLDVALGGMPIETSAVGRATRFVFPPDISLQICSAEDLLVLKAFADRPKDWIDIEGVLVRQAAGLDWPYVIEQLAPLAELKESPGLIDRLEQLRATIMSDADEQR